MDSYQVNDIAEMAKGNPSFAEIPELPKNDPQGGAKANKKKLHAKATRKLRL